MPRTPPTKHPATKRTVDALQPTATAYDVYFEAPKGLHVRVHPSGTKVFAMRFRDAIGGKSATRGATGKPKYRRLILGTYGDLTIGDAVTLAESKRARLARGERPQDDKRKRATVPTVAEVVSDYVAELRKDCTPAHVRNVERSLRVHLVSRFGSEPVTLVTPGDMRDLHTSLDATKSEANHALAACSALFAYAVRQLLIDRNPADAQLVKRFPIPRRRVRPLTDAQVSRLGDAIRAADAAGVAWQVGAALRLLFLTGCRKTEILALRWSEIDTTRGRLNFLDSKGMKLSDTARDQRPIGADALALLAEIRARHASDVYVLPAPLDASKPFAHIDRPWRAIRDAAKLGRVTLHGFRHDMASDIGARYAAGVVMGLMGHASIASAIPYVEAVDDPTRAAANVVGADRAARLNKPAEGLKLVKSVG